MNEVTRQLKPNEMTDTEIHDLRDRIIENALVDAAKTAYRAYGDNAEWLNYKGDPMPEWDDLPYKIALHWIAAVRAILVIRTA